MKNKFNIATIISCSLVIVVLAVMFFVTPDNSMSQKENRTLTQLPSFSMDRLFSGEYTGELATYINDQFPERDAFVSAKAYSELALGKRENNGIIYAENDILIARDIINDNRLNENLQAIKEFENAIGKQVCVAVLPRTVDVFAEYLPDTYSTESNNLLWQDYYNIARQNNLTAPNLYDELCEQNNYYHTDHHYNIYGAYEVYDMLGDALSYTPKELSYFKAEKVSDNFCGTSMRASGFYMAPRDEITLLRYNGDDDYIVAADGKKVQMYDMTRLSTTDQYAVFLGGNHARVDISKGDGRPKLLLIRDSFADSLAPFLAMHYDLIMLDLRYFTENVQQIVADENVNQVLILESMSEFATTKNISYLKRGINE
jgi:hypothetical protein